MIWKILIIISLLLSVWSAIGVWCNTQTFKYVFMILELYEDRIYPKYDPSRND